jgi:hypothetical protein
MPRDPSCIVPHNIVGTSDLVVTRGADLTLVQSRIWGISREQKVFGTRSESNTMDGPLVAKAGPVGPILTFIY